MDKLLNLALTNAFKLPLQEFTLVYVIIILSLIGSGNLKIKTQTCRIPELISGQALGVGCLATAPPPSLFALTNGPRDTAVAANSGSRQ